MIVQKKTYEKNTNRDMDMNKYSNICPSNRYFNFFNYNL